MTEVNRETFQHRNVENLEALIFSMAKTGEVHRYGSGEPVATVADLPDMANEMDLITVKQDGFVRIWYIGEWRLFTEYLAMIGASGSIGGVALPTPKVYIHQDDNGEYSRNPDHLYLYTTDDVSPAVKLLNLEIRLFKYSRKRKMIRQGAPGGKREGMRYNRRVHPTHQDGSKRPNATKYSGTPHILRDTEWAITGDANLRIHIGDTLSRESRMKNINKGDPLTRYHHGARGCRNSGSYAQYFRFAVTYTKDGERYFGPMSEKVAIMPSFFQGNSKKLRFIYADR